MRFSCNFLRLVEVNQEAETQSIRSLQRKNEHQKYGVLKYDFKIEHVPDGGRIQIRIEPKHQIKEILARYIVYNQCTVKLRFSLVVHLSCAIFRKSGRTLTVHIAYRISTVTG